MPQIIVTVEHLNRAIRAILFGALPSQNCILAQAFRDAHSKGELPPEWGTFVGCGWNSATFSAASVDFTPSDLTHLFDSRQYSEIRTRLPLTVDVDVRL